MAKSLSPAEAKAAKAEAKARRKAESKARRAQMWQAFQIQRKEDKRLLPYMIGAIVVIVAAFAVAGYFSGGISAFLFPILGVVLGVLVAFIIFGRRVQKSVFTKAEGQKGAAGWALDNMRGRWRVTTAVAGTTQLDVVHRVIGRPGIIFVAEEPPADSAHCLPRRRSAPHAWSGIHRSMTSSSATRMVRCRCPSWSATSPSFPPTSPPSRWTPGVAAGGTGFACRRHAEGPAARPGEDARRHAAHHQAALTSSSNFWCRRTMMLGTQCAPSRLMANSRVRSNSRLMAVRASRRASAAPTEMQPLTKGDVTAGAAPVEAQHIGVLEDRRITIGRAPQQREVAARGQLHPAECGVRQHMAVMPAKWRLQPQCFFQERRQQCAVFADMLLQSRVLAEDAYGVAHQAGGRLAARTDQLHQDHHPDIQEISPRLHACARYPSKSSPGAASSFSRCSRRYSTRYMVSVTTWACRCGVLSPPSISVLE